MSPRREPRPRAIAARREWLVTNGLGGYASGTRRRRVTRRYHGLLIAALPNPLGPHGDAQPPRRAAPPSRRHARAGSSAELAGTEPEVARQSPLVEFRLEARAAGLALRRRRLRRREARADAAPAEHRDVTYRLLDGQRRSGSSCGPSFTSAATKAADRGADRRRTRARRSYGRFEVAARTELPSLRLLLAGPRPSVHGRGDARCRDVGYRIEESRGYAHAAAVESRAFSAPTPGGRVTRDADRVHRVVGGRAGTFARGGARDRSRAPPRLLDAAPAARATGLPPSSCSPPTSSSSRPAGRAEDATRAPRRRGRGADRHRRLSLVHRLGTRHDDQPRRAHAATGREREAGCILRTFAHYVRDGLIPNMFPDGENEGLYHTADATLWFFHAVDRYLARPAISATLTPLLPCSRHRRAPPRGHAFRHRRGSGRRAAPSGRRGLPVDVDGRESRRLGRHTAPRQGRRDQCAVVQRAVPARGVAASGAPRASAPIRSRHADRAPRSRSTRGSGMRRRSICTMSSTARPATIRRAGPISCLRSRSAIRCSTRSKWPAVIDVGEDEAPDTVRPPHTLTRSSAYCATYDGDLRAAMRRTTRAPSGRG